MKSALCLLISGLMAAAMAVTPAEAARGRRSAGSGRGVEKGSTVEGRTGLLLEETAQTAGRGTVIGTGHLLIGDGDNYDVFRVPFGVSAGVARHTDVFGGFEYLSIDTRGNDESGLGLVTVGLKHVFASKDRRVPDIAVSGAVSTGPLSDDLGDSGTDIQIKGIGTYVLPSRVLLNGAIGLLQEGERGGDDSDLVAQLSAGGSFPITKNLAAIAELSINRWGEDNGLFAIGLRGRPRSGLQVQGLLGFGVGDDAPDTTVGGGLAWKF